MTDWWSTSTPQTRDEGDSQEWRNQTDYEVNWHRSEGEASERSQGGPSPAVPDAGLSTSKPDRRKSLLLGAAGAAVAGILVFTAMPDGSSELPTGALSSPGSQHGEPLPAAGGAPAEGAEGREKGQTEPVRKAPSSTITLSASPDGQGRVGAVMEVTITNGTEEAMVVMSSMVKGDGRSAVIGEGTLAPGSRRIEPGETATGTVEFAAKKAPIQIALMDLSGNVVAASG